MLGLLVSATYELEVTSDIDVIVHVAHSNHS